MFRIFVSSSFAITFFAIFVTNVVPVDSFGFGADWSWEWLWKNIENLDRFDFSASKGGRQWNRGAQRKSRGSDLWWRKFAADWDINSNELDSSEEDIWTSGNLYLNGKGKKPFDLDTEVDSKGTGQSGNGGTGDVYNNEENAEGGSAVEVEDGAGKNSNSSGNNIENEKPEYESESRSASNSGVKASNAGEDQEMSEREGTSSNSGTGTVTTGEAETGENGVQQTSGSKQNGNIHSGNAKSGSVQSGNVHSGNTQSGNIKSGSVQSGNVQSGGAHSGSVNGNYEHEAVEVEDGPTSGSEQSVNVHGGSAKSGNEQNGNVHSGSASNGNNQSGSIAGNVPNGNVQSGNIESGNIQGGNVHSGNVQGGNVQSGNTQNGNIKSGSVHHSGSANGNYEHEAVEAEDRATVKPTYNTYPYGVNQGEREFEAEETTSKATSAPSTTTPGEKETEFEAEGNGQTAAGQEKESSTLKTTSKHAQQHQTLQGSQSYTSARYQGPTSMSPPEVPSPEDIPRSKSPFAVGSGKQFLQKRNGLHSFLPKLTIAEFVDHKITVKPKVPAAAVPPGGANNQKKVDSSTNNLSLNNLSKHSSSLTNSKSSNAGNNKIPNTVNKSSGTQGHASGSQLSHMDRMKSLILKHKNSRIIKEFLGLSTDATKTMTEQDSTSGSKPLGGNVNTQQTLSNGKTLSKTSTTVNDMKNAIKQFREKAVLSLSNRDLIRLMTKMATKLNETLYGRNPAALLGIRNPAGTPNKDIVAGMSSVGIFEEQGSSIDVVPTDGSISAGAKTNFLKRDQNVDQNAQYLNSVKTSQIINNNDKVHGGLSQTGNTGSSVTTGSQQDLHKNVTFFDVSKAKTTDNNVNRVIDKGVQNSHSANIGQKVTVTNNVGQKQHSNNNVSNIHNGAPDITTQQQTTKWVNLDKPGLRSGLGTRWRGSGGWRGGSGTQGRGGSMWLTGSTNNDGWISGAKNDARELAAEMEGQWKSIV